MGYINLFKIFIKGGRFKSLLVNALANECGLSIFLSELFKPPF